MVVEARIRVRHPGCFTESLVDGAYATKISGDRLGGAMVIRATSDEQLDAILKRLSDRLQRVTIVEREPGSVIVQCACATDGIVGTMLSLGCTVLWPAVYSNGLEHYTIVAPTRRRLAAVVDRLRDLGEVHVERVSDVGADALNVNVPLSDVTSGLTERQLNVLQRAIQSGYYESPRRVSTEALAKAFGVSRSTFEEHLRKAEQRVLASFAGVLASNPALGKMATRRVGRPPKAL